MLIAMKRCTWTCTLDLKVTQSCERFGSSTRNTTRARWAHQSKHTFHIWKVSCTNARGLEWRLSASSTINQQYTRICCRSRHLSWTTLRRLTFKIFCTVNCLENLNSHCKWWEWRESVILLVFCKTRKTFWCLFSKTFSRPIVTLVRHSWPNLRSFS